jgi:hypothetical protein
LVSVPVLSEQITLVHPRVSTAGILRTRALRLAISCMAIASAPVTMAASASGTAATARAIANMTMGRMDAQFRVPPIASRAKLTPSTSTQMPSVMRPSHFPISSVRFSSGVFSVSTCATS